jgi:hypothetical protein
MSGTKLSNHVKIVIMRVRNPEHPAERVVTTPHSFRIPNAAPVSGISQTLIEEIIVQLMKNSSNSSTQFFLQRLYSNVTGTNSTVISASSVAGKPLPRFELLLVDSFGNPQAYDRKSPLVMIVSFKKKGLSRHLLQLNEGETCDGGGDVMLITQPKLVGDFLSASFVVDNFIPCSATNGVISYNIGRKSSDGAVVIEMYDVFQVELTVVVGILELFRLTSNQRTTEFANTWLRINVEIELFDAGRNKMDGTVELNLAVNGSNQGETTLKNNVFKVQNVSSMTIPNILVVWIKFYPTESVANFVVDGFTIPSLRRIGSHLSCSVSALCIPGFKLNLNTSQYRDPFLGNCTRCAPGWVTRNYDEFACQICPIGFFSNEQNSQCIKCQGNTIAPDEGSNVCIPCADGYFASPNSVSCLKLKFQGLPPTILISRHQVLIPEIAIEVENPSSPHVQWISLLKDYNILLSLVCNPTLLCTNIQNVPITLRFQYLQTCNKR